MCVYVCEKRVCACVLYYYGNKVGFLPRKVLIYIYVLGETLGLSSNWLIIPRKAVLGGLMDILVTRKTDF